MRTLGWLSCHVSVQGERSSAKLPRGKDAPCPPGRGCTPKCLLSSHRFSPSATWASASAKASPCSGCERGGRGVTPTSPRPPIRGMLHAPALEAGLPPWRRRWGLSPAPMRPPPPPSSTAGDGVGGGLGVGAWPRVGGGCRGVGARGPCCNKGTWRACPGSVTWGLGWWHGGGLGADGGWGGIRGWLVAAGPPNFSP